MDDGRVNEKKIPRRRKFISLETKLNVIKRFERGERLMHIVREVGLNEATCRTIRNNADRIKASCVNVSPLGATQISHSRSMIMIAMEHRLTSWIKERSPSDEGVSMQMIQTKALELYEELRPSYPEDDVKTFLASHGWYTRFKKRLDFNNEDERTMDVTVNKPEVKEEVIDYVEENEEIESFEELFRKVVSSGGYSSKQIINLAETGLFWNTLPANTLVNLQRDKCSLLLGGNANGDLKLKPLMIYHSSNPQPLTGYSKDHLPVIWRSSPDGHLSPNIFLEYFNIYLQREMKDYCEQQDIDFKALLIIQNSPNYPENIFDLSKNIKVLFIPPNVQHLIQPMGQGICTTFKSRYLVKIFEKFSNELHLTNLQYVWTDFNIKNAVDLVADAWNDISPVHLNSMWKNLWPECVYSYDNMFVSSLSEAISTIINASKNLGFGDFCEDNISEYLHYHDNEFIGEELECAKRKIDAADDEKTVRVLSLDKLTTAFGLMEEALKIFDENDSDRQRSTKVSKTVNESISCYKNLLKEKLNHCNF